MEDSEKFRYLKDVRQQFVDEPSSPVLYREFITWFDDLSARTTYEEDHYLRYCTTLHGLTSVVTDVRGLSICETGGMSVLARYLETQGATVQDTKGDLRYPLDMSASSFDIVLSLEVIEHIKDQDSTRAADIVLFTGSGVKTYVGEMQRICRPGGLILLTTPNPTSLTALQALGASDAAMIYRPHPREFTAREITEMFTGCETLMYRTYSCFSNMHVRDDTIIDEFERNGWSSRHRGDDHVFVFRVK